MATVDTAVVPTGGLTSVCDRFASVARDRAGATAVRSGATRLSYRELDARAEALAARLRAVGVRRGDRVGVRVDRSAEQVTALLGVLKAGAAYVAVDPQDPPARATALLADAGARAVLAGPDLTLTVLTGADASGAALSGPDTPPGPEDTAYVAYTSGSTGRPKGVSVPHRAVHRLVVGGDPLAFRPEDVFLAHAPIAFDASTLEVWGALLNGACLVVAPPGPLGPGELTELVREAGVTVLWLTAGLFHQVVDAGLPPLPALRYLVAGGDVLSPAHVDRAAAALPNGVVVNGYGPTENTTFTCCHPVREPLDGRPVPIGRPIGGTRVHVLDERLRPVPVGGTGTLFAAGPGLAHGYLGRPDLTAERFLPDPFAAEPGARMYDTGDRVRQAPDGTLAFLGRTDTQVKLRGFRVELGEVEAAVSAHPDVRSAVVVLQQRADGDRRLAAFYQGEVELLSAELRAGLAAELPRHLVPSTFTWLEALPLTPNGKVDRTALAQRRGREREDVGSEHRPPHGAAEEWLTRLWEEVMEIDGIGADDDFFELGGHSLMATRITGEISAETDLLITARTFYENPTVAELALRVVEAAAEEGADPEVLREHDGAGR
ncbi:non-ribosomal peptide synthetase [Kitasatospora sp. NPDC059146]|uniref:non-ribosomal peptide synthetase n=1 Tax=unclassified Kitasatospora TaxID=2633591 RepID=UPI00368D6BA9